MSGTMLHGKVLPNLSRWSIFSSCLLIAGVCGLTTAFGLISPSLESDLHFSASEIALVASFGNLGTFSGFLAGLMIDELGPRRAVFIGSVFIWFGLFMIWMSVEKHIASSVASLCIFIYIAQLGSATMSQASSSTAMLIMPSSVHGEVASIAKAYYGIAGGVLSSIAGTFYADKESGFILFASIFMPLGTAFGGIFLELLPENMISFNAEKQANISTSLKPYYTHFIVLVLVIVIATALYLSDSGGAILQKLFGTVVIFWITSVVVLKFLYSPGSSSTGRGTPNISQERFQEDCTPNYTESSTAHGINGDSECEPVPHPLHTHTQPSIADEEAINYEMQAHALAEAHDAKVRAKHLNTQRGAAGEALDAHILPPELHDSQDCRVSTFRASLASQYQNKYGKDLNVSGLCA
jgi:MFS family permease